MIGPFPSAGAISMGLTKSQVKVAKRLVRQRFVDAPGRRRNPGMGFAAISEQAFGDPFMVGGRQSLMVAGRSLKRMDSLVKELEQDNRQCKPVLLLAQFLRLEIVPDCLWGDVIRGVLMGGVTLSVTLNA